MTVTDDLFAAILAAPDDDEPRLVWADAVGGERGELVVIQCRLAREALPAGEHAALARRCEELLGAYGRMWSGFAGERAIKRCMFRRGFVEVIEANVTEMPWPQIFELAPLVTALDIKGITQIVDHRTATGSVDPIAFLAEMFAQPKFERLRAVGIDDAALYEVYGDDEWSNAYTSRADEVLALIADSDALVGIRTLAIHDRITSRGLVALARSKALPSIERLRLGDAEVGDTQLVDLLHAMPSLRALDVKVPIPLREYHAALPPALVELRVYGEDDAQAITANVERLALPSLPDRMPPSVHTFELVRDAKPLVHAGTNTREPWTGYGIVS